MNVLQLLYKFNFFFFSFFLLWSTIKFVFLRVNLKYLMVILKKKVVKSYTKVVQEGKNITLNCYSSLHFYQLFSIGFLWGGCMKPRLKHSRIGTNYNEMIPMIWNGHLYITQSSTKTELKCLLQLSPLLIYSAWRLTSKNQKNLNNGWYAFLVQCTCRSQKVNKLRKSYTWKESSMAFRVFSDVCHCLSFALATNKTTVFPFAVAFARLCEPVKAKGVSSTYL